MSLKNIIREGLKQPTLFRDEGKLSIDYTPLDLPHRKETIRNLAHLFKSLIENPGGVSKKVIIIGPAGTGKTAVVKRFGINLQEVAEERKVNLQYVHVNCRRYKTSFMVLNRIIQHFNPKFPKRGFNVAELAHILSEDIFNKLDVYVLLCLDDADQLISKEPSIIYNLTRMQDDSLNSKQRLSLITIAKGDLIKKILDPSISSTFQCSPIHLEKYSSLQLRDILKERIKEAFFDSTVLNESINLISDAAAESGDARYALELLWLAGKYADGAKSLQITPEFVRKAINNLNPNISIDIIYDLNIHQKLFLLAVCGQIKATTKAFIPLSSCQKPYQEVCEKYGLKPRTFTRVWYSIEDLMKSGDFLRISTTQMEDKAEGGALVGLNIPIEILAQELRSEIENEIKLRGDE